MSEAPGYAAPNAEIPTSAVPSQPSGPSLPPPDLDNHPPPPPLPSRRPPVSPPLAPSHADLRREVERQLHEAIHGMQDNLLTNAQGIARLRNEFEHLRTQQEALANVHQELRTQQQELWAQQEEFGTNVTSWFEAFTRRCEVLEARSGFDTGRQRARSEPPAPRSLAHSPLGRARSAVAVACAKCGGTAQKPCGYDVGKSFKAVGLCFWCGPEAESAGRDMSAKAADMSGEEEGAECQGQCNGDFYEMIVGLQQ